MSSTVTGYSNGVTLGSNGYTSPLTITSSGNVNFPSGAAIYAAGTYPAPATVINQGMVVGTAGIVLDVGGTVTNSGTIIGTSGTAVYLGGTGANRLVLSSGYKFTGVVIGSTAAGATNTLELTGSGTLSTYLPTEFFNFGTLVVDSGLWVLRVSNKVGVLSNLGTIGYDSFAYGLTITKNAVNSGTITDHLYLQGASLTNAGRVRFGVKGTGVFVDNQAGGTISGYGHAVYDYSTPGTVVNDGLLAALQFGAAVTLKNGGVVTNRGTISAAPNSSSGILLSAGGTVTNGSTTVATALVQGGAPQAATGYNNGNPGGAAISGASGSVTNYGTLAGAAGGVGANAGTIFHGHAGGDGGYGGGGISFAGAGVVINSGTLLGGAGGAGGSHSSGGFSYKGGSGGYGGPGIAIASGTVQNNSGRIVGGTAGTIDFASGGTGRGGFGVTVSGMGTVSNSGTVIGGNGGTATNGHGGIGGAAIAIGGGVLSNTGAIAGGTGGSGAAAAGSGAGGAGVTSPGTVTVTNTGGTITGGAGASPSIGNGGGGGAGVQLAAGTVINTGALIAGNGGTVLSAVNTTNAGIGGAGGTGVSLSGVGYVNNTGTIAGGSGGGGQQNTALHYPSGNGGNGGSAIVLAAVGYVKNTGFIIGGAGGAAGGAGGSAGAGGYGLVLGAGGTVVDSGTIVGANGTAVSFGGTGSNLLVLEHGYGFSGVVTVAGTSNTLKLLGTAGAVTVSFNNGEGFTNFGTVTFGAPSGNSETLKISDTTHLPGTISGFTQFHDIIDLTQISPTGIQTPTLTGGNQLVVTNGSQTVDLQLDSENYSGVVWQAGTDGSGGTDIGVACYCRGTLIETPEGEVAVEDLAIGDLVTTLSGESRPVRWVGRRAYDGRFIAGNRQALPICVRGGALGEGIPARDLWVSPGHALYLDGVLVQAEHLVNGATIVQADSVDLVEYFHIELDSHDIIIADGAAAESYTDCDNRYMFSNGAEYAALYLGDDRPTWEFCLRRLEWEDAELTEIRAALSWRAAALGHDLTNDPDLHLVVDGAIVRPVEASGRLCRFVLPEGSREVLLASRSSIPAEIEVASRDTRRLGVPVEQIVLYDENARLEIGHRHAALSEGFHGAEPGHRWTDGLARLPDVLPRAFPGPAMLDIHLAPSVLAYREAPASIRTAA